MTILLSVIGTFLLALLLLPKLRESAAYFGIRPRLSFVTSDLHFVTKFSEQNSEDIFTALKDENSAMGLERCVQFRDCFASFVLGLIHAII